MPASGLHTPREKIPDGSRVCGLMQSTAINYYASHPSLPLRILSPWVALAPFHYRVINNAVACSRERDCCPRANHFLGYVRANGGTNEGCAERNFHNELFLRVRGRL